MSENIKVLDYSTQGLRGRLQVPSDKSISHRSALFGAIAEGKTVIHDYLLAQDTLSTIHILKQIGIAIEQEGTGFIIEGKGWNGFQSSLNPLDAGNSGTTIRLLSGILASLDGLSFTLTGDSSLQKRPMKRIMEPLTQMGGYLEGREGNYAPLTIEGQVLQGIEYQMPVASAQVKSAILLAGLNAISETRVIEKMPSRNHTEVMIPQFGGEINVDGNVITLPGKQRLQGTEVIVPGDISSAAFFIVAGLIVPKSEIILENVCLNPTRAGILQVVQQMGGQIEIEEIAPEIGNIRVWAQPLQGTVIEGEIIPSLIDELPIIALMATQAEGQTIIRDAGELKVKESDRIQTVTQELTALGADITATDDGFIINGPTPLHGGIVDSHGDHRLGMMLAIASLMTDEMVKLRNAKAVDVSYRQFYRDLEKLI